MFYPFAVGGGASDPKGSSAPRESKISSANIFRSRLSNWPTTVFGGRIRTIGSFSKRCRIVTHQIALATLACGFWPTPILVCWRDTCLTCMECPTVFAYLGTIHKWWCSSQSYTPQIHHQSSNPSPSSNHILPGSANLCMCIVFQHYMSLPCPATFHHRNRPLHQVGWGCCIDGTCQECWY